MFTIDLLMLTNALAAYQLDTSQQNQPQDTLDQRSEGVTEAVLPTTPVAGKLSPAASQSNKLRQRA